MGNNPKGTVISGFTRLPHTENLKGFTLIELLISIAIIGLITGIVVFKQNDFADQVALNNVAHEVELLIRESQVYGISVREYTPSSNEFNVAYGIDFNRVASAGGTNASLISFVDRSPKNGVYDTPTSSCVPQSVTTPECLIRYNLPRSNVISNLCVIQSNGNSTTACYSTSLIGRIDVTFVRPDPDARLQFYSMTGVNVNATYPGFLGAKIVLQSPKGKTQNILIYSTGDIEIQ